MTKEVEAVRATYIPSGRSSAGAHRNFGEADKRADRRGNLPGRRIDLGRCPEVRDCGRGGVPLAQRPGAGT
jgi:hypothetical protein